MGKIDSETEYKGRYTLYIIEGSREPHADYLGEFIISSLLPSGASHLTTHAIQLHSLENDIRGFYLNKPLEHCLRYDRIFHWVRDCFSVSY